MENQFKGYDNIFSSTLREVMMCHPETGEKTTQKALAEAVGIRPQTISLYLDGSTQPNADNLFKIARYFNVSVDFLLTGVSSENKAIHETFGLSEAAVNMLKYANKLDKDGDTPIMPLINDLFSDKDFYQFLEDMAFKADNLRRLLNQSPEEKQSRPEGIDMEGYARWDILASVQEFVIKMLRKKGIN